MSEDELKATAISTLKLLVSSNKVPIPLTSLGLLTCIITAQARTTTAARIRLTDLARLETILEDLSRTWADGHVTLLREPSTGEMTLWDIALGPPVHSPDGSSRKRKRVVDEDADSADGARAIEEERALEENGSRTPPVSTLGGLNKELREVYAILQRSTAKGRLLAERFRSYDNTFEPICSHITKDDCAKARNAEVLAASTPSKRLISTASSVCDRIHFRPLLRPHTDPSLGHCSYLNTCYSEPTYAHSPSIPPFPGSIHAPPNMRGPTSLPSGLGAGGRGKEKAPCRYLHYEIDYDPNSSAGNADGWARRREAAARKGAYKINIGMGPTEKESCMLPPQWLNCDLRRFDYSVLGKFHVIMADPPWDIHMSLPYGTMTDDEMRAMPIPMLQDEGLLFLWVTGRAMEVGRECLRVWGYTRVDEVVWVKTNQLQRVIRTGRTGHWLNHTKEHMLVGVKTTSSVSSGLDNTKPSATPSPAISAFNNKPVSADTSSSVASVFPPWVNRGVDTDVIVSEVRETSRKPEEVYGLIERMCPGGRKVEIFGRRHNTRPGWLTLGNQLGADQIYEADLAERIKARYPERKIVIPPV